MVTIRESEADLEQILGALVEGVLPQTGGYSLQVELFENGRKKRRDASRDSLRPGSLEIRIKLGGPLPRVLNPEMETPEMETSSGAIPSNQNPDGSEAKIPATIGTLLEQFADFIKSLQIAELRPGFNFVSLKWFRDVCLPAEGHRWSNSTAARDQVLRDAIKDSIVLTSKVPNPKSPSYPVTAIRLNRQHPQVAAVLGEQDSAALGFQPVDIRGEPLSETVLRDRR